jgi:hypothetical protein
MENSKLVDLIKINTVIEIHQRGFDGVSVKKQIAVDKVIFEEGKIILIPRKDLCEINYDDGR